MVGHQCHDFRRIWVPYDIPSQLLFLSCWYDRIYYFKDIFNRISLFLGYTFLIGGISFQLYPIWEMIWEIALTDHNEFKIFYSTTKLMLSSFCAGAVLITYGGIIGKVSGY